MRSLILCLAFLFVGTQITLAQSKLTGKVANDDGEDIFFATVALRSLPDSAIVMANSTEEDGSFELTEIKDGNYYLEVSMLGYLTHKTGQLNFPNDNGSRVDVSLSQDAQVLSTVEVTAKTPLLEQKSDRLIVNVENNLTGINGNILDVMKKVPGMLVIGNNLRMIGESSITILINGKTTKYMDIKTLMRDIPGDNIKKVEVIHQPGAEFDAQGSGSVINIILKKNSLLGTNGNVSMAVAKGVNWKGLGSVSLSHYQGDVNISGSVGYQKYASYDEMQLTRRVSGDVFDQKSVELGFGHGFRGNLNLDWDISQKHRMGFSSQFVNTITYNPIENTTNVDFKFPLLQDLELLTDNFVDSDWKLFAINPYYVFKIDTSGQKLEIDANIARISRDGTTTLLISDLNSDNFIPGQQYVQPGESKIFVGQIDYTYPISKALKVQVGAKYSDANLDNDLRAFDESSPLVWEKNIDISNHFIFDETILAGYTKLNFNKGKWSGTLGLRFEESNSEGYSVTIDSTQTRKISQLFPSFSVARQIAGPIGASFAYSYRIDRPRYSTLNPFVFYLDRYTSERGNPTLRPGLTHSGKFNVTYENQPFISVSYKSTKDAMVEVTEQDDDSGETSLWTVNLNSLKIFNSSVFFPLEFGPAEGFVGLMANQKIYDSDYLNESLQRNVWDFTAFLEFEIPLPYGVTSEISAWYNSGEQDGLTRGEWIYGVDIGFGKNFLNNQLMLSLGVENLFNRFFYGRIEYANMDLDIFNRWDGPEVSLQVLYKFGNRYMKDSKKRREAGQDIIHRARDKS